MTDSCQMDQDLMEDVNSLWSEGSSSSSSLCDSQLTQPSNSEEREHLKVYLRIRPFTAVEAQNGESQDCVSVQPPDTVLLRPPGAPLSARLDSDKADKSFLRTAQRFHFSQVYGPDTTQRELFQGTVKDLVKDVLHGGNSLVFTYGVTNAGKTFTFLGPDADAGVLPRSLDVIFSSMEEKVLTGMSIKPQRCREFVKLSEKQQAEEAAFKSNLLRHFKDSEKAKSSMWSSSRRMLLEGSSPLQETTQDRLSLQVETDTKFSVWVSFCEIYNENIHDLLEASPGGAAKRTALRLSQDVKGSAFVKDLRWVQVDSTDEAYQVMKLGKKNQSFSSTRNNQLSSRSHSIFSIRLLRIKDTQSPRVVAVSELCLCDLAGSERCAKTLNRGERLKEAGNINTSLLILGKCINGLRHNQRAKLPQHVPFRESKLTRYLQAFFCGRGKVCMLVNVNRCASAYDETLHVLKFSAVAQKVVLVPSSAPPVPPQKSSRPNEGASETRRDSPVGWERGLEDPREVEDEEKMSIEDAVYQSEEEDVAENEDEMIFSNMTHQQVALLRSLQTALKKERADGMLVEARLREDISREFGDIFAEMQNDFAERLARERELLEQRAEKRLEIFKKMTDKMAACRDAQEAQSELTSRAPSSSRPQLSESAGELQSNAVKLGESSRAEEEKTRLVAELQEKCSALLQLEKRLADMRAEAERTSEEHASLRGETKQLREALASLREERAAQEDVVVARERKARKTEKALQEVSESRGEATASVQDSQLREQEAPAASGEAEEAPAGVTARAKGDAEKRSGDEALDRERSRNEEVGRLLQEVRTLTATLEASQNKVSSETLRAEQASAQLRAAQEQLRQTSAQISVLRRDPRTAEASAALSEQLGTERPRESTRRESQTSDLVRVKEDPAHEKISLERPQEDLDLRQATDGPRAQELRRQSRLVRELREKLRRQQEASEKQLKEFCHKLREREASCDRLRQKLAERELTTERLKTKLQEASSRRAAAEEDQALWAEVASSKENEETRGLSQLQKDKEAQTEELRRLTATLQASQPQEAATARSSTAELESGLREREAQIAALQKKLQERRGDGDEQALRECRRTEAERRRELLAVAHEAIEQKDAELEKRALEITKLKELAKQDSDKVKRLGVDLERKEEDSSDLREKLADYKKQIQQVHKDISTMKEEEKLLTRKLSDVEKVKKQLQFDLTNRDRTIQQLKAEQPAEKKRDEMLQLYHQACQDLEAKRRLVDDMRSALLEQEETQEQMEHMLDEKVELIQELTNEVEQMKEMLGQLNGGGGADASSRDLQPAKRDAARARRSLEPLEEKQLTERHKWQEDKMALIGQLKEAEDKRNQEVKRFAKDRERYLARQAELNLAPQSVLKSSARRRESPKALRRSPSSCRRFVQEAELRVKEQTVASWRTERDALVGALEVQLRKLLASQADKDEVIRRLRRNSTRLPPEGGVAGREGHAASVKGETEDAEGREREPDAQDSSGGPSVLESSQISTENGRAERFPQPELEISFSPLRPDRVALRRPGEPGAVTVKITRSARKRTSAEMDEDKVEAANRRNAKVVPTLSERKEETSRPSASPGTAGVRGRKEGTLQKIGDFLQSSPTLIGCKAAKKVMSLMSGVHSSASSSVGLTSEKSKRKLPSADICSPADGPRHTVVSNNVVAEDKRSERLVVKRRLRSRIAK
ncbi:kinesin-like protein KIF20B isoform X3 [Phycodurus eques]|uniref:kinesin-like protein KIF20B isoform X3 n=1 Tax=Phycodurus eques TaxID=693459 RepID=UPI002ACE30B0|nr:kinesin-like protein KIF20B isoform X3 [Phycodurus eques]